MKSALGANNFARTILNNLSNIFDYVPHGLLISKLKIYG